MHLSRSRRPAPPRPRRAALLGLVLTLAASAVACDEGGDAPQPAPPSTTGIAPVVGGLVVVLPPADGLAEAERARLRLLVGRALDAALPTPMPAGTTLLEPADRVSLGDAVELAVRRVGAGGTVCVLGADVVDVVAPVLALYPAVRPCFLPLLTDDAEVLAADVDLELLGRELGAAARAAAGGGAVLVLDASDAMVDRRWRAGTLAGSAASGAAFGAVHTLRSAQEVLDLLDAQDALVAEGILPGGPDALVRDDGDAGLDLAFRTDLPAARALPPVAVVVLDASREAELLIAPLAERGLGVVAPRSLVLAAETAEGGAVRGDAVVLRWRVRWDVRLVELVRRAMSEADVPLAPSGAVEELFVLEPGPAYVTP